MVSATHPLVREVWSVVSSLLDPDAIVFRPSDEKGVRPVRRACESGHLSVARLPRNLNRNPFLCGCLDFTEHETTEHLIVGLGRKIGSTTSVQHVLHTEGSTGTVTLPEPFKNSILCFARSEARASVVIFHNHPPHPVRRFLDNVPLASDTDRRLMLAFQLLSLHLGRRDIFRFYVGENGFVREFRTPQLLDIWDALKCASATAGT